MKNDWAIRLMDKLAGDLTEKEAAKFEDESMQDEQLADEYQFYTEVWDELDHFQVPEPQSTLSDSFYNQLYKTIDKQENAIPNRVKNFVYTFIKNTSLVRNMSLGMLFLAVGFILGGKWNKKTITVNQTTVHASPMSEVTSHQQFSGYVPTTQKIQFVNAIPQTMVDKDQAFEELKHVLQSEKNTNVKLAALRQIETHYSDIRGLRHFLAQQIEREQSPLVQAELLNLLVDNNQPRETIQTMESILKRKQLNPSIQEKIKNELPVLRASYVN